MTSVAPIPPVDPWSPDAQWVKREQRYAGRWGGWVIHSLIPNAYHWQCISTLGQGGVSSFYTEWGHVPATKAARTGYYGPIPIRNLRFLYDDATKPEFVAHWEERGQNEDDQDGSNDPGSL